MNPNPNQTTTPDLRKTQCITLYTRQQCMLNYFNIPGTWYIGLGKTSAWSDANDPAISDTYPPMPDETSTTLTQLIGMQRIEKKAFAKVYVAPTTEQKKDPDTIYYKGLYYETTEDVDKGISEGFTSIMFYCKADRDRYFPIGVQFRQVGLYGEVGVNDIYLSGNEYNALAQEQKGHLYTIANFSPNTRQADQQETFYILIDC